MVLRWIFVAFFLSGCASKDVVSTPMPPPAKKIPNIKLSFLSAEFSGAHQEDNYDKQYNDTGGNVKFYWVAQPVWEPNAAESNRPETWSQADRDFAQKYPWIQSRSTKNYPIVAIQKRIRAQKFFMMDLSTWDVCYMSRVNLRQSMKSRERYALSEADENELAASNAYSANSTPPSLISCNGFDRIRDVQRQLEK